MNTITKLVYILLTPTYYLYVWAYRLRELLFSFDVLYRYLPEEFDRNYIIVHMDLFWIKRGYIGRNKCLIPKGHPNSNRFNEDSMWYESWIGTYTLRSIFKDNSSTELEKVCKLGMAAIEDQNYWMITYGVLHPNSYIDETTVVKVGERKLGGFTQHIFYGEIVTDNDDSKYNKVDFPLIHLAASKVVSIYNRSKVDKSFLLKDGIFSDRKSLNLFGYFSYIELNKHKYLLSYACGTKSNKEKVENELLKVMNSIDVVG